MATKKDTEVTKEKKIKVKKTKKSKEEKVIKPSNSVEVTEIEVLEEPVIEVLDEKQEVLVNTVVQDITVVDTKHEKKKRFFSELKSFFIIVLIIGLVILAGWLFIKYAKPLNDNDCKDDGCNENPAIVETNDDSAEKVAVYKLENDHKLSFVNEKYLVEYSDTYVYKIMDANMNLLYEGEDEYTSFYEGYDGGFYVINDTSDGLYSYKLELEKLVEVYGLEDKEYEYSIMFNNLNKLVGFVGVKGYQDEENEFQTKTMIYKLDGTYYEEDNFTVVGDSLRTSNEDNIITMEDKYLVVRDGNEGYKYGVYDLANGKMIIKAVYDELYTTTDGNYIAKKDSKYGIIDLKLKKLVDFEYEFIQSVDNYYLVGKNDKLAIMNSSFKLITDFEFEYKDEDTNYEHDIYDVKGNNNKFYSYLANDRILLFIKNYNNDGKVVDYSVYIIDNKGEYTTIKCDTYNVFEDVVISYNHNDKVFTVYDKEYTEKYKINLSDYDYGYEPQVMLIANKYIAVMLDSNLYFDVETGEEVNDISDFEIKNEDILFKYSSEKGLIYVYADDKELVNYSFNPLKGGDVALESSDGKSLYFFDEKFYILIKNGK